MSVYASLDRRERSSQQVCLAMYIPLLVVAALVLCPRHPVILLTPLFWSCARLPSNGSSSLDALRSPF